MFHVAGVSVKALFLLRQQWSSRSVDSSVADSFCFWLISGMRFLSFNLLKTFCSFLRHEDPFQRFILYDPLTTKSRSFLVCLPSAYRKDCPRNKVKVHVPGSLPLASHCRAHIGWGSVHSWRACACVRYAVPVWSHGVTCFVLTRKGFVGSIAHVPDIRPAERDARKCRRSSAGGLLSLRRQRKTTACNVIATSCQILF